IGYLQWHFKTRGNAQPSEPVLKNYKNIENRDAILAWDREELVCDAAGKPMTRWDGHTMKAHPVTGRAVPDEQAREEMVRYVRPCPAAWPAADFIVGNPPFQGGKDLRDVLGDGYAKALWKAHPEMPGSADLVMYWWGMAADRVRRGKAGRFGLITTNSLPQTFNRRVVERHLGDARAPLSLAFAIPDHPWVDEAGSANVRIAMTVGIAGAQEGKLQRVVDPMLKPGQGGDRLLQPETGKIAANLRLGADLTSVGPLMANEWLCSPGVKLHGAGFIVTPEQAAFLGLGTRPGLEDHILDYRNGRDLTARPRGVKVIDLFGLEPRDIQARFPEVYQWILERVKPERDGRAERSSTADAKEYARKWWLFGKPRSELRPALEGLERYIATVETAKHRLFMFLDARTRPDNMLVALASEDAAVLGVLSSRIHVVWAIAAGGRLGFGNDPRYNKTRCFDPFPFPAWSDEVKARVGDLAERLDAHRKRQQGQNPGLTMTGMYNVLEKLKTGEALTAKERADHERGLVSVLLDIHRELDAAVAGAYGWPADLSDEEVLARLVALNHERRAEEAAGTVRWLRPDYQIPKAGLAKPKGSQAEMDVGVAAGAAGKTPWPANLPDQVQAVRRLLAAGRPVDADLAGSAFKRAKRARVEEVLQTLAAMGQARPLGGGRYAR
ncbi:MAG: class I SAM-dependent DNA methyltransferase, partial [Geminicoccaceae bacterium]|nr:class I SAM-dependent DNA methyltransferase [Geminicoccaceae bacterium]